MASTVHLTHWLICAQVKDGEKVVASFYLDPYARPADKRGGAWMDVCVGKSRALKRDVPTAYLYRLGVRDSFYAIDATHRSMSPQDVQR